MDVYENRRLALINAMHARCNGKQVNLSKAIKSRPDYVSRLLSSGPHNKRIGGDYAREIEVQLQLPPLWLDQPQSAAADTLLPATNANVVAITPLQHESHRAGDQFWGVVMFASDLDRMNFRVQQLRAAMVTDAGMQFQHGMTDYVVVIDTQSTAPSDGDVFLIVHGNKLKVRRLLLGGSGWVGRSDTDNPGIYPDIPIDAPDSQILGRTVWGCGAIR